MAGEVLNLTAGKGIDLKEGTGTDAEKLIISSYFSVYTCGDTSVVPQNLEKYNVIVVANPFSLNRGAGVKFTYYILTQSQSESSQATGTVTQTNIYKNILGSGTITAEKVGTADWTWTITE